MLEQADAGLLIGDHAIKASWRSEGLYVTDLGEEWKRWTGYSMTFAVWAVRRAVAAQNPAAVAEIASAFRVSKQRSLSDLTPVISEACEEIEVCEIIGSATLLICVMILERSNNKV